MIQLNSIPVPVAGINVRELGDTIIIINENGDELHSIDEIGSFIWKSIDGASSVHDILDKLCGAYEVDRSRAEGDLKNFLIVLKEKKLIISR